MLNPRFVILAVLSVMLSACGGPPPGQYYNLYVKKDDVPGADYTQDVAACKADFAQSAGLIDQITYAAKMDAVADCMRAKGWTVRAECSGSICADELAKEAQRYTVQQPPPPLPASQAPDFPLYDVPAFCKASGPCTYWQQQDYGLSRERWSEATTRTKIECANSGDYVMLYHCLEHFNAVQAQTDQLEQIEHPQPFHY